MFFIYTKEHSSKQDFIGDIKKKKIWNYEF